MIRYSDDYIIVSKDLDDGFVKRREFKGLVEYWIYKAKYSNILLATGEQAKLGINEATLAAIITCKNYHTEKRKNNILVAGYKFTSQDLDNYLSQTNRGING